MSLSIDRKTRYVSIFPIAAPKHVLTLFNVGNELSYEALVIAIVGAIVKL